MPRLTSRFHRGIIRRMTQKLSRDDLEMFDLETAAMRRGHALRELYVEDARELLSHAELEQRFLLQDAIPEAGLCFLAGKSGSCKSWLAYDLALAVARARPWLIFRYAECRGKRKPVLVLNYDNPNAELARRFLRLGMTPDDPIHFHSLAREMPREGLPAILRMPQCLDGILMIVDSIRPGLILIDSLRQSHTLDEMNSSQMGLISACLRQLTMYGATVLAIHHKRKGLREKYGRESGAEEDPADDESMRGSGEIIAAADTILHAGHTKKLPGETTGVLFIGKTRGFVPTISQCDYAVRDDQDGPGTTHVVPGGRLDVVLAAIKKHGPITRRELIRKVAGLEPKRLAELVNLCIEFGRVKETSPHGGTRQLIAVEPAAPAR